MATGDLEEGHVGWSDSQFSWSAGIGTGGPRIIHSGSDSWLGQKLADVAGSGSV
jgi:hypothetical protein